MAQSHVLKESPSQTAGPYVHIGLTPNFAEISGVYPHDLGATMITGDAAGEHINLCLRVLDGMDEPMRDALVEIWQADNAGVYNSPSETRGQADPHFTGWGRKAADPQSGEFHFATIKPGRAPHPDGRPMAPHISVWIVARGINIGLHTRVYFADEEQANTEDPVLARIEHRKRVQTLMAIRKGDTYSLDIHLQGKRETVFFDI
ncbi:protocatechuate 3,4-dioxygenase subunit alpha [Mesorhizobium sp. NBSH29]|uniref:protocatechuate 3,4-dioxygenase subunit alpha n=1 Tax=Mesorhizobium sp. NBSH29 TaxID=2654249 RepID=UPI0018966674|nr:protocatechuate 3,4-dioxygenase subunit alpha [Mesorhizobium sp. NBSH29]QPC85578.1 protocatechuate 3,4-dioxygenase subunit alpha [Mesorhizobium sp. NBSH29]